MVWSLVAVIDRLLSQADKKSPHVGLGISKNHVRKGARKICGAVPYGRYISHYAEYMHCQVEREKSRRNSEHEKCGQHVLPVRHAGPVVQREYLVGKVGILQQFKEPYRVSRNHISDSK